MFRHVPGGHIHQCLRNTGLPSPWEGSSVATDGSSCQQTGKQEMTIPLLWAPGSRRTRGTGHCRKHLPRIRLGAVCSLSWLHCTAQGEPGQPRQVLPQLSSSNTQTQTQPQAVPAGGSSSRGAAHRCIHKPLLWVN